MFETERVRSLVKAGAFEDALSLLDHADKDARGGFLYYLLRGETLAGLGQGRAAIAQYEKAKALRPSNPWAYIRHSQLLSLEPGLAMLDRGLSNAASPKDQRPLLQEAGLRKSLATSSHMDVRDAHPVRSDGIDSALLVMMFKDEEDILGLNLDHHYRAGFRRFALANNGSSDRSLEKVEAFQSRHPDAVVICVSDPIVGHYQDVKTTALAELGARLFSVLGTEIKWVFPLDADEFLSSSGVETSLIDLITMAEAESSTIIAYYLCDMASSAPFKVWNGDDVFSDFPIATPFLAKPIPKVAFRYSRDAFINMGNHTVDGVAMRTSQVFAASAKSIFLSHFPVRSVHQATTKYINGGRAIEASPDRRQHGGLWQKMYRLYLERGPSVFEDYLSDYVREVAQAAAAVEQYPSQELGSQLSIVP